MARAPDVVLTPISPAGTAVGAGLAGDAKLSDYSSGSQPWVTVDRSRRTPYLEFASVPLYQLEVPLILDGADTDSSVEPAIAAIKSWRKASTRTGIPTVVSVAGPVDSIGVAGWAILTVTWDTAIRRVSDGARTQQTLTMTLIEHTDGSAPAYRSPAAEAAASVPFPFSLLTPQLQALASSYTGNLAQLAERFAPNLTGLQTYVGRYGTDLTRLANAVPQLQVQVRAELANLAAVLPSVVGDTSVQVPSHRTVIARPGDNLESIAGRELGDYRKWPAIGLLNGIRDPNHIRSGQEIRLP